MAFGIRNMPCTRDQSKISVLTVTEGRKNMRSTGHDDNSTDGCGTCGRNDGVVILQVDAETSRYRIFFFLPPSFALMTHDKWKLPTPSRIATDSFSAMTALLEYSGSFR